LKTSVSASASGKLSELLCAVMLLLVQLSQC